MIHTKYKVNKVQTWIDIQLTAVSTEDEKKMFSLLLKTDIDKFFQ